MFCRVFIVIVAACQLLKPTLCFVHRHARSPLTRSLSVAATQISAAPFVDAQGDPNIARKADILQLAASLDRGQAYNPTSGEYYRQKFELARSKVAELVAAQRGQLPTDLAALDGEWELVFTTVKHGIFRSSPFFLAIQVCLPSKFQCNLKGLISCSQEAFTYAEETTVSSSFISRYSHERETKMRPQSSSGVR